MESVVLDQQGLSYEQRHISEFNGFNWKNSEPRLAAQELKSQAVSFARASGFKETGMSVAEIGLLYDLLEAKRPRMIVELGRNYGTSTRLFMQHIIRHGGHLDSWDLKHWPGFLELMGENGYEFVTGENEDFYACYMDPQASIELRIAHSIKTPVGEKIEKNGVDFLLIDTEHGIQHALGEYMRWREYLNGRALIAFHDSTLPAVARSIELVKEVERDADKEHGRFAKEYVLERQDGFGIHVLEVR